MRVAMFESAGKPLRITKVPDPEPAEGQVVVKVCRCGICSTDLHLTEGHGFTFPSGAVPGHEFAGEVVALGRNTSGIAVGDRVAVLPALSCGRCRYCLAGTPFACVEGSHTLGVGPTWGGYGEYALASGQWCLPLPDALDYDDGALIEPMAVGLHGIRMGNIQPGDKVLVIGAGPVGLAATFGAARAGARVAVTATSRRREALAMAMGAESFIVPEPGQTLTDAASSALDGRPDVAVECAGVPGMIDLAISTVRRSGTILVLGICTEPERLAALPAVLNEVTLRFALAFERRDYQSAIDAIVRGSTEHRGMLSGSVSLDDTPAMFETLRTDRGPCKVMIDPWK